MELRYRTREVQISDYFRVLYRRRVVVLLTFLAVFASVLIHTFLMTPVYEAFALVQIKDEKTQNALLGELVQIGRANPVAAEMEVIHSRTVAEAVVRELRLDVAVVDHSTDLEVGLKNVDVDRENRGRTYEVEFLDDQGRFEVNYKGDTLGPGDLQKGFHAGGVSFELEMTPPKAGAWFGFVQRPFDATVRMVQQNLAVNEIGDRTQIVKIAYRSQSPQLARDIVNKTVDVYEQQNVDEKQREARQTVNFIETQLDIIRASLSTSEDDLRRYKEENKTMALSTEANVLIDSVAKFEVQRAQLQIDKNKYGAMLASIQKYGAENAALPSLSSAEDTVLAGLGQTIADLKGKKNALLAVFTEKHPDVVALTEQIKAVGEQVISILQQSLKTLDARLAKLEEIIGDYDQQVANLPSAERDLAELLRSSEVTAQIYTFLLTKKEEARIAMASTISNVRTIDRAVTPHTQIKPNIQLNLLLGAIAGLLLAIGVAFFLEFIDDSLKSIEEVERFVRRPIYGIIPRIPETRKEEEGGRAVAASLVTHYSPKSPISEAFRTLRTNIQFADPDRKITTLLVTSAGPSEGKSTIVTNLALTFANIGRRTLLIDCDLRKPNVHNIFEIPRDPGLTTVLLGERSWQEVMVATKIDNLHILPSGPIPPNPTEMLGSQHMKDLLAQLQSSFDLILFDSPPVVAVTDAAILSSIVDGTLLVVELGRSRASGVNRAIDLLEKVNAKLLGVVTNNIFAGYRYDYGYYSYYYYYAEGGQKRKRRRRSRYGY
jgi:tyrosine-protein kinase Etk/Wzc